MTTTVADCIRSRKSVRAFTSQPVDRELIVNLLDIARHAPSGANTQPWQVAVLAGKVKDELQKHMESAFRSGARVKKTTITIPKPGWHRIKADVHPAGNSSTTHWA